jgi:hypothetical protein
MIIIVIKVILVRRSNTSVNSSAKIYCTWIHPELFIEANDNNSNKKFLIRRSDASEPNLFRMSVSRTIITNKKILLLLIIKNTQAVFSLFKIPKILPDFPSHQIFRRMHRALNIGKKITNCTVCL